MLSPCLFNAALEAVIRRWKSQLGDRGLQLDPARERLTNVRFADDLLLFGSSMAEVVEMFELLSLKLEEAGLSINPSKTKMFTTGALATSSVAPMMVDAAGSMVELVRGAATHKYLGRMFSGDLTKRGQCNLSHRLSCGWFKFHCFQHSLLNRKILCTCGCGFSSQLCHRRCCTVSPQHHSQQHNNRNLMQPSARCSDALWDGCTTLMKTGTALAQE